MENVAHLIFYQSAPNGGGLMSTLLMFGAMFAILYFILIRPQQKQQKKQQAMLSALKKGDEVVLSSGIMGKIFTVEDQVVILEIYDKTKIKVLKQAVSGLVGQSLEQAKMAQNNPKSPN